MFKILFFTDSHAKGKNPKSRLDFFPRTIIEKHEEIARIAVEEDVDIIIHGGDFIDTSNTAPNVLSDAIRPFVRLRKEDGKLIPFYKVLGNHTVEGNDPAAYTNTGWIIAETTGFVKLIDPEHSHLVYGEDDMTVQLTGMPSHPLLDVNGRTEDYIVKKEEGIDFLVHTVHGFLTDHQWPARTPHTLIDNVLDTEADVLLTGHEHQGYGIIKRGNTTFCNPGSIARVSADLAEIARMPKVAIITLDKDYLGNRKIDIELRQLKCAKPGSEILSREAIEEMIAQEQQKELYTEQAKVDIREANITLDNIVKKVEEMKNLSDAGKVKLREYIQNAERELAKAGVL